MKPASDVGPSGSSASPMPGHLSRSQPGGHNGAMTPIRSPGNAGTQRSTPLKRARESTTPSSHQLGATSSAAAPGSAVPPSDEPPKKKAPKKAVSCEACRRRKLKCDRGWPCGACRDRGESSLCEWADGVQPQSSGRDAGDGGAVADRLDRLEALMGTIAGHLGVPLPGHSASKRRGATEEPFASQDDAAAAAAAGDRGTSRPDLSRSEGAVAPETRQDSGLSGPFHALGYMAMPVDDPDALVTDTLTRLLPQLPESVMTRKICLHYLIEIGNPVYVIDKDDFMERQAEFEDFRTSWDAGKRSFPLAQKRDALRFLALAFACCAASLTLEEQLEGAVLEKRYGRPPQIVFISNGHYALGAVELYEELDIINVRALLLLQMAVTTFKGPALGRVVATQTFSLASLMNLEVEPQADLPEPMRKDRIRLFATICTVDWIPIGTTKRMCFFEEEYLEYPSLFDRDGVTDKHNYLRPDSRAMLELARLSVRAGSRVLMREEAAYEYTGTLQTQLRAIEAGLPPHLRYEGPHTLGETDTSGSTFRLWCALMIQRTMIVLHKHFYIQSWTRPEYKSSRTICFNAAASTVKLCRDLFRWFRPRDDLSAEERQALMFDGLKNRRSSVSKVWHAVQMALLSSLVLVHCLSMLEMHPEDSPEWDLATLRSEISEDLRFMRMLVQALSPRAEGLREGMKALDPSAPAERASRMLNTDRPRASYGASSPVSGRSMVAGSQGAAGSCSQAPYNHHHRARASAGTGSAVPSPPHSNASSTFEERTKRRPVSRGVTEASSVKNFDDLEALWAKQPWSTTWSTASRSRNEVAAAAASGVSSPSSSSARGHYGATPPSAPPMAPPSFGTGSHLLNELPSSSGYGGPAPPGAGGGGGGGGGGSGAYLIDGGPRNGPHLAPIQSPPTWPSGPPAHPTQQQHHPHLPPPHEQAHAASSGRVNAVQQHQPMTAMSSSNSFAPVPPTSALSSNDWRTATPTGQAGGGATSNGIGADSLAWLSDLAKVDYSKTDAALLEQLVPFNPLTSVLVESLDGYVQNMDPNAHHGSGAGATGGGSNIAHDDQQRAALSGHNALLSMAEAMRMDSYM